MVVELRVVHELPYRAACGIEVSVAQCVTETLRRRGIVACSNDAVDAMDRGAVVAVGIGRVQQRMEHELAQESRGAGEEYTLDGRARRSAR